MFMRQQVLRVLIAVVALLFGLLVYLFDRRPEHIYFLSRGFVLAHEQHSLFGVVGNWLPAFVHVYAFILLTAAVAGATKARLIQIGAAWFVIAALFEIGQLPQISTIIAARVPAWIAGVPILDNVAAYFLNGTFDVMDLLAIVAGTVAATLTAVLTNNGTEAQSSFTPPRRVLRGVTLGGIGLFGLLTIVGSGGGDSSLTPGGAAGDDSLLYVSGNSSDTLLIYDAANTVSGSTAASRTVTGASAALSAPRSIAVDMPRNQIYLVNSGGNAILVFNNARTVSGDMAPDRTISNAGALMSPTGLFVDPVSDRLYVTSGNSVLVYDSASTLNGTSITPARTLTGAATTLTAPTGIFVDATRDLLYVANGNGQILVFDNAAGTNGNIAPVRSIPIASNSAGIFVDVMADRLYVAKTSADSIFVFDSASTAGSSSAPDRTLSGASMLNQPRDIFVDTGTDRLYVANAGDDTILVFNNASTANGTPAPDRILSLPASTGPWGIYVDVTPLVIGSTASLDGYARSDTFASASGSPATGDKDASAAAVGWRQLYSFDIASIPSNATITAATVHLYQCDVQGFPYDVLGDVLVDHVNYGGVFDPLGSVYDGATIASNIGTLSATTGLGYRSLGIITAVQNDLTAIRTRSQYRLRFSAQDSNFDSADDFAQFTDAEDSLCAGTTTGQPPQLAVTLIP